MPDDYVPRNFRIISIRQQKKILHIEDALAIDKIHFDAYDFVKGQGTLANAKAYVGVDEARLLFYGLRHGRIKTKFQAIGGSYVDGEPVARVLTVEEADTRNPIRFTVENGPAIHDDQGLFQPAWWKDKNVNPIKVPVLISRQDAVMIGLASLEHLQAWATATYWQRIQANTWQANPTANGEHIDPLDIYQAADGRPVDPATGEFL